VVAAVVPGELPHPPGSEQVGVGVGLGVGVGVGVGLPQIPNGPQLELGFGVGLAQFWPGAQVCVGPGFPHGPPPKCPLPLPCCGQVQFWNCPRLQSGGLAGATFTWIQATKGSPLTVGNTWFTGTQDWFPNIFVM
jgi:hypothetical protein